jgi:hypothetical protein
MAAMQASRGLGVAESGSMAMAESSKGKLGRRGAFYARVQHVALEKAVQAQQRAACTLADTVGMLGDITGLQHASAARASLSVRIHYPALPAALAEQRG